MVEFADGSTLAQASPPDMALPISLALGWPDRVPGAAAACDWSAPSVWEFFPLDEEAFPAVALCREAGTAGGTVPAVLNAANEECVAAFRAGRLGFLGIVDTVAAVVGEASGGTVPSGGTVSGMSLGNHLSVADVLHAEAWARARAREIIEQAPEPNPGSNSA
jgi:1-deoxy-D-xylulose-5-phosphate reductoisomerase